MYSRVQKDQFHQPISTNSSIWRMAEKSSFISPILLIKFYCQFQAIFQIEIQNCFMRHFTSTFSQRQIWSQNLIILIHMQWPYISPSYYHFVKFYKISDKIWTLQVLTNFKLFLVFVTKPECHYKHKFGLVWQVFWESV